MTEDRAELSRDDAEKVMERWRGRFDAAVPRNHPRLHVTKANLSRFKAFTNSEEWQQSLLPVIVSAAHEDVPSEPVSFGPRTFTKSAEAAKLWRQAYSTAGEAGGRAQALAFGYLLTGNRTFAATAKAIALEMASWDPAGTTAIDYNDEAFIRVIHFLPFVYTWLHDYLTAGERVALAKAIERRGELLYTHVAGRLSLTNDVYDSHPIRFVATLGLTGLALYHELAAAKTWLSWAAAYYELRFPVWGGDAGGWSEGVDYWTTGVLSHLEFLDALEAIGVRDLYDKPFFRNTGYFGLYFLPTYPTTSFGDINRNKTALAGESAALIRRLAYVYNDPFLYERVRTQTARARHWYGSLLYPHYIHRILHADIEFEGKSLSALPSSRLFNDIGWVAMHSHLGHDGEDIFLAFKCSPYGSRSHSHADQNSFILNAFGKSLFIDSGYREWWRSQHHWQWYKQTRSKNAVLIAGEGQAHHSGDHPGAIVGFFGGDRFTWAAGEAARTYPESDKYGKVHHCLRSIVFVNREYFLVYDYIETEIPVRHQWLLHADHKMEIRPELGRIHLQVDDVRAEAQFLLPAPDDLRFTQTDEFSPPVDERYRDRFPNQWHVQAETVSEESKREFAVILSPYRREPGQPDARLQVESQRVEGGLMAVVHRGGRTDRLLIASGTQDSDHWVDGNGLRLRGHAGVIVGWREEREQPFRWFIQGRHLEKEGLLLWAADQPGAVEAALHDTIEEFVVKLSAPGEARFRVSKRPRSIQVNGETLTADSWSYDASSNVVRLRLPQERVTLRVWHDQEA